MLLHPVAECRGRLHGPARTAIGITALGAGILRRARAVGVDRSRPSVTALSQREQLEAAARVRPTWASAQLVAGSAPLSHLTAAADLRRLFLSRDMVQTWS